MKDETKCCETVYPKGTYGCFHGYQCTRKAVRDGYCTTHHPDTKKARDLESSRKWREKMDNSPLTKAMKRIAELEAEVARLKAHHAQDYDPRKHG